MKGLWEHQALEVGWPGEAGGKQETAILAAPNPDSCPGRQRAVQSEGASECVHRIWC